MLRVRILKDDSPTRRCDECGRLWHEVATRYQPDPRPFSEIRGALGQIAIKVIICPECADELLDGLWPSASTKSILASNRSWELDEVRGAILGRGLDDSVVLKIFEPTITEEEPVDTTVNTWTPAFAKASEN